MVLQMLYSSEYTREPEELIALLMGELKVTKKSAKEAYQRVELLQSYLEEIDPKIREVSTEYQFERISQVEKNLIRWGVFEIMYGKSLPQKVVFSEATRLCRKFGTPSSACFVHAILDKLCPLNKGSLQESG